MPFIDNFICFAGNGMIESMLEPHLKSNFYFLEILVSWKKIFDFFSGSGATQSQVGTTFLILGGVYAVTTPFVGYVSIFPSLCIKTRAKSLCFFIRSSIYIGNTFGLHSTEIRGLCLMK